MDGLVRKVCFPSSGSASRSSVFSCGCWCQALCGAVETGVYPVCLVRFEVPVLQGPCLKVSELYEVEVELLVGVSGLWFLLVWVGVEVGFIVWVPVYCYGVGDVFVGLVL